MGAKSKTGKRSSRNVAKRTRYSKENRPTVNKIKKLKREIKRLEGILIRNPEAKVERNIKDLTARVKYYQSNPRRKRKS